MWQAKRHSSACDDHSKSTMGRFDYAASATDGESAFLTKEASPPVLVFAVMHVCVDSGSHKHLPRSIQA